MSERFGDLVVRLPMKRIAEVKEAAIVGVERTVYDFEHRVNGADKGGHFYSDDRLGLTQSSIGSVAEFFFSIFRGVAWNPSEYDFNRRSDVDGFEVRGTTSPSGECPVRDWEVKRKTYAFVVVETWLQARVVGWIPRIEAERVGDWKNPNGWGYAWFVGQDDMRPFNDKKSEQWREPSVNEVIQRHRDSVSWFRKMA